MILKNKHGWQVAIDLTSDKEENKNIIDSPLFDTEEEADKWYRELDFSENEIANLEFIMIQWVEGKIENTYVI